MSFLCDSRRVEISFLILGASFIVAGTVSTTIYICMIYHYLWNCQYVWWQPMVFLDSRRCLSLAAQKVEVLGILE